MKMMAAVLEEVGGTLIPSEIEVDDPRAGEVLVRIVGTGICHTDLVARKGDLGVPTPIVLGHEGSGVVEAIGPGVTRLAVGDHVVLTSDTCGTCRQCQRGGPMYCEHFMELNFDCARADGDTGYSRDGQPIHGRFAGQTSFSTHTLVNERVAVKVPKDAPIELLGPFGCAVQTGAGAVINSLAPTMGDSIVVFGAGSVGLCAIMAARAIGCGTIVAVDVDPQRLELARELGATHGLDGRDPAIRERIREATDGLGADYALEMTGIPAVMETAVAAIGRRGVLGLIGIPGPEDRLPLHIRDMLDEGKTVRGIVQGDAVPDVFIPKLIRMFQRGDLPVDRLITRFAFDQLAEAFEAVEQGTVIKAVVDVAPAP